MTQHTLRKHDDGMVDMLKRAPDFAGWVIFEQGTCAKSV